MLRCLLTIEQVEWSNLPLGFGWCGQAWGHRLLLVVGSGNFSLVFAWNRPVTSFLKFCFLIGSFPLTRDIKLFVGAFLFLSLLAGVFRLPVFFWSNLSYVDYKRQTRELTHHHFILLHRLCNSQLQCFFLFITGIFIHV